jgi:hypothetical protein
MDNQMERLFILGKLEKAPPFALLLIMSLSVAEWGGEEGLQKNEIEARGGIALYDKRRRD